MFGIPQRRIAKRRGRGITGGTPGTGPVIPDGGWQKLPQFLDRIAAMPGLGASAADTTYTGSATAVDIYIDSINGNDSWDGTAPFHTTGNVGPKASLFPASPGRTTLAGGKKYGILAGSTFSYAFGSSTAPGPLIVGANTSFVGIARTSAAAVTTGPIRSQRTARVAGQELKPLRNQFDIGRLGQWIDDSDKNEWFWFCMADSPTSTAMSGTQGICFNLGTNAGFILRNCWEEGFRGGMVACDVGFVMEDCYCDNNYNVSTTVNGSLPSGWFLKSNAQGQTGFRLVGTYCGGNIGEDMIWNQQGSASTDSGFYDFQIKDCCLRMWCVAQTLGSSDQHSDWWQGGGYPGNFLIQRVVGEHVISENLLPGNIVPQGQGFLTNNTGNVVRTGGVMRDFLMYSNGVVINENHTGAASATGTLTRDHVAFMQSRNPAFDGKVVTCVNLNQVRSYADTACKLWFDGKKTTGFIDQDATSAELSSRTSGQWSTT